jgi:hypothetical protein
MYRMRPFWTSVRVKKKAETAKEKANSSESPQKRVGEKAETKKKRIWSDIMTTIYHVSLVVVALPTKSTFKR